jgi:hypothetical protein
MGLIEILFGVAFPVLVGVGLTLATAGNSPAEFIAGRVSFILSAADIAGLAAWWLYVSRSSSWKFAGGAVLGTVIVLGLPEVLKWVDSREAAAIAERKARVVADAGQVAPLIEVIRQQQSMLAGQDQAQRIIKRILDQYDQLQKGIDVFERSSGRTNVQDRLAAAEHILKELTAAMSGTVQLTETPDGRALVIKTAPNTFRVTFPVPMRIAPNLTFPRLPAGVTANVVQKSNVGFTVVFAPPTVPVETLPPLIASAEL